VKRLTVSAVRDLTFGRHSGRTFEGLAANFVVVYGPNESGKSSLAEFLTWAIGGPWRAYANNTEAFRGSGDGKLGGQLLGTLGSDPVELRANFELKKGGTPRDKRRGYIGATEVDGATFQKFLGGIGPADYELMYRCYGANLGDIGSGGSFENLFAQFAMGGISGVRNPREALTGLHKAKEASSKVVKDLTKALRKVEDEIKIARSNPEHVQDFVIERDGIVLRIEKLDIELADVERRRSLVSRVIDGRDHLINLDRARAELDNLPVVSPEWLTVVGNAAGIADLTTRIISQTRVADDAESSLATSAAAAGMDVARFDGRTFSAPERLEITTATNVLLEIRDDASNAQLELKSLNDAHVSNENALSNLARSVGIDDGGLVRLDAIESQLPDLVARADRWLEDTNKVVDAEAQVAGETERRKMADGIPTAEPTSRGLDPKLVASTVLLVAGVSVMHWVVAIVVALGATAYFLLGRAGRSVVSKSGQGSGVDNGNLANLQSRAAEFRESARLHRNHLDEGLADLAKHVTTVDLARKQLTQLADLASRRKALREHDVKIEMLANRVAELKNMEVKAERAVRELLEPRGIALGLVNTEFEKWLTKYEASVNASASLSTALSSLSQLRRRLSELTSSVDSDIVGLAPQAIATRVREMELVTTSRRTAETTVREADGRVRAAKLKSPDAEALLREHPDLADLKVLEENFGLQAAAIRSERDQHNARLGEIRVEIDRLEGTEILPGLLLKKGILQDEKDEAEVRHRTLSTAHELIGAAIDDHERDNQDPVVERASALVAEVVPDWGSIIKSRDEDGKMSIQRLGSDGRIGDYAISDGGRALLYLAVRIAFAQEDAGRRQIALPIICDDPLIHFDDVRRDASMRLLQRVSNAHQVVLFTCESDTRDTAASLGATIVEI